MAAPAPRVVEGLNVALHRLFDERPDLHLIGEDVLDPYGGAFKVTRGLSTRHPGRVLTAPLSEAGIAGAAAGLALGGDQVVVEVMFGDFAVLMFDQLLNLVSKSVTMYGHTVPMPVVVRCPVGGRRGYGPTHSQSVQKHFLGIPNLSLYETSPFHDPYELLAHALDHGPAMLFEDKILYTRRFFRDGDGVHCTLVGAAPGWAHVRTGAAPDAVLVCPGGVAHRGLAAAERLRAAGVTLDLLVPGRLHPLDLDPVLPLLTGLVVVAEESTAGGTWGSDVAAALYERLWGRLDAPVLRLSSADSIIPTAQHLEEQVLLGEKQIVEAVTAALGSRSAADAPAGVRATAPAGDQVAGPAGIPVTVPKLNNNDETYLLLSWLVDDGAEVEADTPLAELESSKTVEEIQAGSAGAVRLRVPAGTEVPVGAVLAEVTAGPGRSVAADADVPTGTDQAAAAPADRPVAGTYVLSRAQRGTAAVVARAHREVPAAFTAVEVPVGTLLDRLRRHSDECDAQIGLPEAVVRAVAFAHADFGHLFGTLVDDHTVALAGVADIAVTLDAGHGLFTPVLRDCARRPLADLADDLMELRLKAWSGEFTSSELAGAAMTVSLNTDEGVLLVHPIVMWPQLCMVSVGGPRRVVVLEDGAPAESTVVTLGLAYDHRVVNGRDAVAFLRAVGGSLSDPARVEKLTG